MSAVKLWDCRAYSSRRHLAANDPRSTRYLATTRNVPSKGLGHHGPDVEALRDALPHYARNWDVVCWYTGTDIGECVRATVKFSNGKSASKRREIVVYCDAYVSGHDGMRYYQSAGNLYNAFQHFNAFEFVVGERAHV